MKHLVIAGALALCLAVNASAQEKTSVGEKVEHGTKKAAHKTADAAKTVAHKTEKGAKKVGNKTAEVASKGAARVADRKYEDKLGPEGQTLFIDEHSKYYYVDEKGHHVYVTRSQMKNK